ncbi:hypothetical protein GY45DRAFT_1376350 [Cubamyces sp. BRFM 1775]|nr:hypothetical protein GY45DRAFT_1376350 [Cubamyces sp. BRFM 1775]
MDSVNAPSSAIDYQFYSGATGPRAVDYANRLPSHFSDDDAEESDNARSSIRMMDTVQARLPDSGFRAVSVRSVSPASDIQIIEHPQANAEATAVRVLRTLASRAGSALRGSPLRDMTGLTYPSADVSNCGSRAAVDVHGEADAASLLSVPQLAAPPRRSDNDPLRRLLAPDESLLRFDPFAPSVITSSRFLREVLELRVSMIAPLRASGYRRPDLVIPERELRALLVKAMIWMVDRECLLDVEDVHFVLVGREPGELGRCLYPSVSLDEIRLIAEELPDALTSDRAKEDFDAFIFHAGTYFTDFWTKVVMDGYNAVIPLFLCAVLGSLLGYVLARVSQALM